MEIEQNSHLKLPLSYIQNGELTKCFEVFLHSFSFNSENEADELLRINWDLNALLNVKSH
jgi:hypothetical protein